MEIGSRRRDFTAGSKLTQRQVTADGFLEEFGAMARTSAPFLRYPSKVIGIAF